MTCGEVSEALEMYIVGDLDVTLTAEVAAHLSGCARCRRTYEELCTLIGDLKDTACAFQPLQIFQDVPDMAAVAHRGANGKTDRSPRGARRSFPEPWRSRWLALAVGLLLAALVAAITVVSVPALAEDIPLPIGHELARLRDENRLMRQQSLHMQKEIDQLKTEIITIEGQRVPQVDTANPAVSPAVNAAVQGVVVKFVMAQYAGDLATLKELATAQLQARIAQRPQDFLRDNAGKVSFAQLTDVSTINEGGATKYLEFVRLMDSKVFNQSQYQENFTLIKSDGHYLVDSMEMDA